MLSINIGNIPLAMPVILAPMSGVTDLPFRKLVKRFGAGLVVSEMVASKAMILETKKSLMKSKVVTDDATSACVQLAGCDPKVMGEAAKMNQDLGVRILDINFGCPAKKVVGGYAGSALMRDEVLAAKILENTVNSVSIPVTLKMRTGWDHSSRNAVKMAQIAENCGIKMLTIHGRTRCQFYSGKSDWEFIKLVKDNVKIPVIANGDVTSTMEAKECLKISGADGVMIGRGAYGKPWLLNQISKFIVNGEELDTPSIAEQHNIVQEHYESMLEYYGTDIGVKMARKHLGWYSSGLSNSSSFRATINTTLDVEKIRVAISRFYDSAII